MPDYRLVFSRSAAKELEALPERIVERILKRIEELATTPRPIRCRKLVGSDNLWRIRVSDYRVVYAVDDTKSLIDIVAVRHRRDAYR
jgi:mRNA interferase RelE/StbE